MESALAWREGALISRRTCNILIRNDDIVRGDASGEPLVTGPCFEVTAIFPKISGVEPRLAIRGTTCTFCIWYLSIVPGDYHLMTRQVTDWELPQCRCFASAPITPPSWRGPFGQSRVRVLVGRREGRSQGRIPLLRYMCSAGPPQHPLHAQACPRGVRLLRAAPLSRQRAPSGRRAQRIGFDVGEMTAKTKPT